MNKPRKATLLTACLPAFIFLSAQTVMAQDTEIRILCSNGFHAAMEKLVPQYEHSLGRPIKLQFGASATLKKSIEAGDEFDLAILTPIIIEDLVKQGKIAQGTSVDLASSGIGMAVRAGVPKPDVGTAVAIKQ
ncbi:MAG: substrate-binding domain-containing protein, partial [Bryobacteraceae bacterium]